LIINNNHLNTIKKIALIFYLFCNFTLQGQITNNVIGDNQTVCDNGIAFPLKGSEPLGGNGTYTYLWIVSNDSINWNPAIGTNNEIGYMFSYNLTAFPKFYFAREVESGGFTDTSNVLTINVLLGTPPIINNIIANDQAICWGEIPDSIGGIQPSGGNGIDYYYIWLKSADSSFVNPSFVDIYNNSQYYSFLTHPDNSYYYARIVTIDSNFTECPTASNFIQIEVFSITDNFIDSYQGICENNIADTIKGPEPNSNYYTSLNYEWLESIDKINWGSAYGNNNNNKNYYPQFSSDSMYYRRKITALMLNGCDTLDTLSNVCKVVRNEPITDNEIYTYTPIVCTGSNVRISPLIPVQGGNGNYAFLWEESTDSITWIPAGGIENNQPSYLSQPLYNLTYFRRIVFSGGCTDTSNIILIQLDTNLTITNNIIKINGENADTICNGAIVNTITGTMPAGGIGVYDFFWYKSTDGFAWDSVGIQQDYTPVINTYTAYYLRIVYSGICSSESNFISVNVINANDNYIDGNQFLCTGEIPDTIYGTYPEQLYGSDITFSWEYSTDSINWISVSNQQNYFPGILTETTYYRRKVTLLAPQCAAEMYISNVVVIEVSEPIGNNFIFPASFPDYSICNNTQLIMGPLSSPTGGNGNYLYLWQDSIQGGNWNNAPQTNDFEYYQSENLTQTTYFRRIVNSCMENNISSEIEITIKPSPSYTFNYQDSICKDDGMEYQIHFQGELPWGFNLNDGTNFWSIDSITDLLYIDSLTPTVNSDYSLTSVFDAYGCEAPNPAIVFSVVVIDNPVAFAGYDTTICELSTSEGLSAIISVTGNHGEWISQPDINFDDIYNPKTNIHAANYGEYSIEWIEFNEKCDANDFLQIEFIEPLLDSINYAGKDIFLDYQYDVMLNAILPPLFDGHWELIKGGGLFIDDYDPNTIMHGIPAGENLITWTLSNGICETKTDTLLINVNLNILIPSGFSPNSDGVNDKFVIKGLIDEFDATLWIYDRWGNEILYQENYNNNWEGKNYNDVDMPNGTYFYILEVKNEGKFKGYLVIKR